MMEQSTAFSDGNVVDLRPEAKGEEVMSGDRKATNAWLNPQFIFQVLLIIAALYVEGQGLKAQASRIESQMDSVVSSVQTLSTAAAEQRANDAALAREMTDMKQTLQLMEARIIVLEKGEARLDAQKGR